VIVCPSDRLLGINSRSKTVLLPTEIGFKDRSYHQQCSHLGHPVPDRGYAERPLAAIALGNPHSKEGQRCIRSGPQLLLQLAQPRLHPFGLDLLEADPVYTRCPTIGMAVPVCFPKHISTIDLIPKAVEPIAGFGFGFCL
jgi:hypothetical protein